MRMLYKYPQAAFPYGDLVDENRRRGRDAPEYELIDTGVFDGDRYFDVFVEYAKADAGGSADADHGRQPRTGGGARSTCCRRSGSATPGPGADAAAAARSRRGLPSHGTATIAAETMRYGRRWLYADGDPTLLFTENETNAMRLFGIADGRSTPRTASTRPSSTAAPTR